MGSALDKRMCAPLLCVLILISASVLPDVTAQEPSNSLTDPVPSLVGRNLDQQNQSSELLTERADDTVRADPLDGLKKYRGGYNITNKHYWSSTIFTGAPGYVIGVAWLLSGIVYGGITIAVEICCKGRAGGKLKERSFQQLRPLLPVLLTILAIVASGLLLGGNCQFHAQAKSTVNIIMETATDASRILYNTSGAMDDMRNNLQQTNGISEASVLLTSTSEKLGVEAQTIQTEAHKNRRLINRGLKLVYIVTTVTISLNLAAAIALSACGMLRLRRLLVFFIIVCWFLTALCWVFFGLYFFLDKFSGDTCTALAEFEQNPANSSLSSLLPCDELLSEKSVLTDVGAGIYNLVNAVNRNISESYPNFALVCNPFSAPPDYLYQPENCAANTIRIRDIPKVLKPLTCLDESDGTCEGGQLISNSNYQTVVAFTSSIQDLLNVYPEMEILVQCQSVKDAFSQILLEHCKPMKNDVRMVWAAMAFLAVIMVVLVLTWTVNKPSSGAEPPFLGA